MSNIDVFPEIIYEFNYGYKYLLHFTYTVEDRKSPDPYIKYKHQVSLYLFRTPIFSLILRANRAGTVFVKGKEVH